MYENQGIYSLPRIKGNLLGTFNSQTAKTKKNRIEACTFLNQSEWEWIVPFTSS